MATYLIPHTVGAGADLTVDVLIRGAAMMDHPEPGQALLLMGTALRGIALAIAPLTLVMMAVGVAGNLAQVGFIVSGKVLKPQLKRLNPLPGIKRMFGPMSLWQALKSLLKVVALIMVTWPVLRGVLEALAGPAAPALGEVLALVAAAVMQVLRKASYVGLALAAIDWALQRRKVGSSLKMSKQELKEEARSSEGDPHMKGAIKSKQFQMSRNRMMADVGNADVVVVNPTHIAVALKYDAAKGAPRVVARGAGQVATGIRERALAADVPIVQDIPLARTLYKLCEVGQEIPVDFYEAVARVLAFVFALRARGLASGLHVIAPSKLPDSLRADEVSAGV